MSEQQEPESRYRPIEIPREDEWHVNIPEHLMANCSEGERWLYPVIGTIQAQSAWLIRYVAEFDKRHRELDVRLQTLEIQAEGLNAWKRMLKAQWGVLCFCIAVILPSTIRMFGDFLFRLFDR